MNNRDRAANGHLEEIGESTVNGYAELVASVDEFGCITIDGKGRIASWNLGAERLSGFSPKETIGRPCQEFLEIDPREFASPTAGETAAIGSLPDERKRLTTMLRRKCGIEVWTSVTITPLFRDGRFLGSGVVFTGTDAAYRTFLDQSADACYLMGRGGIILEANERACQMLGYAREDFIGQTAAMFDKQLTPELSEAIVDRLLEGKPFSIERTHCRRDGVELPVEVRIVPLRTATGLFALTSVHDISAHKSTQDEWRRALSLLQAVVREVTDAVCVKDPDGRYLFVNEAAAGLVGSTVDAVIGKTDFEIFLPEEAESLRAIDRHILSTGRVQAIEDRLTAAGVTRAYLSSKAPWRDESGKTLGIVSISRDVTRRVAEEESLQRQCDLLEQFAAGGALADLLQGVVALVEQQIRGSLCSILLLDDSQQRLRVGAAPNLPDKYNRAIDGMAIGPDQGSCGAAAFRGENVIVEDIERDPLWNDFRHLALPHDLRSCWSVPIFSGANGCSTPVAQAAAGRSVLGTFAVYRRQKGAPSSYNLEVVRRAAHLASIAIQARRTEVALRESERRLKLALAAGQMGVWDLDIQSDKLTWTGDDLPFPHELGATLQRDERRKLIQPDDLANLLKSMDQALKTRQPFCAEARTNFPNRSEQSWFGVSGMPIFNERGVPIRFVGTMHEITARKKLEERLREAQKMEAIGRLAGGIAHDFNNVLTVVSSANELLLARGKLDDRDRANAVAIREAAERAAALTRQLLAFSRRQKVCPTFMDINVVLRHSQNLLQRMTGRSIKLIMNLDPRPLWIKADPVQIEQVFLNLVANSRDAIESTGKVIISTRRANESDVESADDKRLASGRWIEIAVEDTGVGIPPELLSRIFEPFFTTKETGQGTGLGLAVVHGVVQQCGGEVQAVAQPHGGAKFRIVLPESCPPSSIGDGDAPAAP